MAATRQTLALVLGALLLPAAVMQSSQGRVQVHGRGSGRSLRRSPRGQRAERMRESVPFGCLRLRGGKRGGGDADDEKRTRTFVGDGGAQVVTVHVCVYVRARACVCVFLCVAMLFQNMVPCSPSISTDSPSVRAGDCQWRRSCAQNTEW